MLELIISYKLRSYSYICMYEYRTKDAWVHGREKVLQRGGGGHKFITLICIIINKKYSLYVLEKWGAWPPRETRLCMGHGCVQAIYSNYVVKC